MHLSRIWVKCKGVWGKSTPNEKDHFHKALPNVKNAYVTLRKFTPDLKIFYTDISAISVPLCNSGDPPLPFGRFPVLSSPIILENVCSSTVAKVTSGKLAPLPPLFRRFDQSSFQKSHL